MMPTGGTSLQNSSSATSGAYGGTTGDASGWGEASADGGVTIGGINFGKSSPDYTMIALFAAGLLGLYLWQKK